MKVFDRIMQFLPPGWSLRKLGDICNIVRGSSPRPKGDPQYFGGEIPWITIADINAEPTPYLQTTKEGVTLDGANKSRLLKSGELILSNSATICVPKILAIDGCIHDGFLAFEGLEDSMALKYMYHYFNYIAPFIRQEFKQGATQVNLNITIASNFVVPCPPLSEQKRIADILDKADAIRRKRKHVQRKVDQLLAPVFFEQFGDPVLNSQRRETITLSQYGNITTGNTPSRKDPNNYGDAIEWIKSDNINTPSHWLTHASEGLSYQGLSQARTVDVGATLVTCIAGSPECVGNAAITNRKVAFNQQINAITPANGVDPFFLYVLILLSKPLIQSASTQSMKGMVSKSKFEQVKVIFAPHAEQLTFNRIIQKIFNMTNKQRGLTCQVDDLFNSLVQRAFKGEL